MTASSSAVTYSAGQRLHLGWSGGTGTGLPDEWHMHLHRRMTDPTPTEDRHSQAASPPPPPPPAGPLFTSVQIPSLLAFRLYLKPWISCSKSCSIQLARGSQMSWMRTSWACRNASSASAAGLLCAAMAAWAGPAPLALLAGALLHMLASWLFPLPPAPSLDIKSSTLLRLQFLKESGWALMCQATCWALPAASAGLFAPKCVLIIKSNLTTWLHRLACTGLLSQLEAPFGGNWALSSCA